MTYQDAFYYFLPFTVSIENGAAAALFAIIAIVLVSLLILALARKIRSGEKLKYEFITIIAHKFRTPLTQVKWSADELAKNEPDPYKKQGLQDIRQANEKLIKLTGTLIELTDSSDYARSSYALERVSLCDFVRSVGEPFKNPFHEKNIFFSIQCGQNDVYAKIDRQRLEFVLQAMFENALAYTGPGKEVRVRVEKRGRKAVISVEDQGIGIDKDDIPNIFTKFFRAENAQSADTEGFGVGLYLAQAIARRHKGSISAESSGIGTGATFSLTLPAIH